jgi:hypothetical protein
MKMAVLTRIIDLYIVMQPSIPFRDLIYGLVSECDAVYFVTWIPFIGRNPMPSSAGSLSYYLPTYLQSNNLPTYLPTKLHGVKFRLNEI